MTSHLNVGERDFLYRLRKEGMSVAEIARWMGRDRSTIYRDLRRNTGQRGYRPKHREVARVEELLNERPRRRLGYRTPAEVLVKRLYCN